MNQEKNEERIDLDRMLAASAHDYKIFEVENGEICLSATSNH